MKKIRRLTIICLAAIFSLLMISSCEIFNPIYEEFELYGTWDLDEISLDIDISGDNKAQVVAARALIAAFKGKLEDEMNDQIDSLGGQLTFNEDYTYILGMMEEADTGTWYFNQEESSIALQAEEAFIDELNIEKLRTDQLIISWISDEEEFETDTTDESIAIQVTIEAVFLREE